MSWHNYFMNGIDSRAWKIGKRFAVSFTWESQESFYIITPCISITPVYVSYAKGFIIMFSILKFSIALGFVTINSKGAKNEK